MYDQEEIFGGESNNNESTTSITSVISEDTKEYGDIVLPTKNLIVNNKAKRLFGKPMKIWVVDCETKEKNEELSKKIEEIRDYNDYDKLVLENEKNLSFHGKSYFKVDKQAEQTLLNFTPFGNHYSHNNNNRLLSKVDININVGGGSTYYQVREEYTNNALKRKFAKIEKSKDGEKETSIKAEDYANETGQTLKDKSERKGIPIVVFENIPTLAGNGLSDFADTSCIEKSLQISWNRLNENALLIKPRIGYNGKISDADNETGRMKLLKSKGVLIQSQETVDIDEVGSLVENVNIDSNIAEADFKDFNKKRDLLFEQVGRRRTIDSDKGAQQTSYQVSQSRDNEKITDDDFIRRRQRDYKLLWEKALEIDTKKNEVIVEIKPNYTVDDNAKADFYVKAISAGFASKELAYADMFNVSVEDAKSAIKDIQDTKEKEMEKKAELTPTPIIASEQDHNNNDDTDNLNNKSASVSKPNERTPKNESDTSKVDNKGDY